MAESVVLMMGKRSIEVVQNADGDAGVDVMLCAASLKVRRTALFVEDSVPADCAS
jgi:hypothetical protein